MFLPRALSNKLLRLFQTFPVVVLTGARQVGKSTLLRHLFGTTANLVEFDPVFDIQNARKDPELFLKNQKYPLILDEVQYCPEVLPAIKRAVDKHRAPGQFVLTGSQQWGVMKSAAESLAGRAVLMELDGFSLGELAEKADSSWLEWWLNEPGKLLKLSPNPPLLKPRFPLFEQLWRGFMPAAQFLPLEMVSEFQLSYLKIYLERDIRMLSEISDIPLFSRFVHLLGALTAQEINYSHLGRELGLNPQTAKKWLQLLLASFQWFELPPYSPNPIKTITRKGKGFFADTGLAATCQGIASPQILAAHPLMGSLFETAVITEIRKQSQMIYPRPTLTHWRSLGGAEVDLILLWNHQLFPMEIKLKSHPGSGDSRGLRSFRAQKLPFPVAKGLILSPSETIYPVNENDYVIPWNICGN